MGSLDRIDDAGRGSYENDSPSWLLTETFASAADFASRSARQAGLIAHGLVAGACQEAERDPLGAAGRLCAGAAAGAGIGVLAVAETPVIAGGALALGAGMTALWARSILDPSLSANQRRNAEVTRALDAAWRASDAVTRERSEAALREQLGSLGLDMATALITLPAAGLGAKAGFVFRAGRSGLARPGRCETAAGGTPDCAVTETSFLDADRLSTVSELLRTAQSDSALLAQVTC